MTKLTIDGYQNKIENKYFKWYKNIIQKRLLNSELKETYKEKHHILPVCLGGSNDKENLINLSAKEHYILHLCLIKFITGQGYFKVLKAFNAMSMKTLKNTNCNSLVYDSMRKKYSEELSKWLKSNSPFKDKNIHKKTMNSRVKNKSNIFETNNPMFNEKSKRKKIEKTSGKNHYLTKKYSYEYSNDNVNWVKIDNDLTVKEICKKYKWSVSTFNYILSGRIPKRGNMNNLYIRKIINENNKN